MDNINNKIKVLVVDDSAFMRRVLSDMLKTDEHIVVVDTARNGKDGIEKAKTLAPDVITLDIEMPIMDGFAALPELMKLRPAPKVLMISSLTHEGAEATIKALELGAVDFIAKPASPLLDMKGIQEELLNKIINIAKSKVVHLAPPKQATRQIQAVDAKPKAGAKMATGTNKLKYIIAIGTSTGGPRALQDVIPLFPADIPAAILIVQHMPPGFTKSLSTRLDSLSNINVKEAEDGDILKAGWAYVAPGDYHMLVNKSGAEEYKIEVNHEPLVTGHRPSVNAMMTSVAECGHKNVIAVMMTGMGSDGSEGILKIKRTGGKTIAQNEDTCVVYGMPKSAVNIGAIDKVVPLQEITSTVLNFMEV